jgi:hypothetical protein
MSILMFHLPHPCAQAGDISALQKISVVMQPDAPTSSSRPVEGSPMNGPRDSQKDAHSPQAVILEGTKCYNAFAQVTVLLEEKPENGAFFQKTKRNHLITIQLRAW